MSESPLNAWLRFALVAALILGTALLLNARGRFETVPHPEKVASFPMTVGGWAGSDAAMSPEVLEVLGPGDFLSRFYLRPRVPYVDFFVAYFSSQRTGDTMHSPRNCLPGAGWTFSESQRMELRPANHEPVRVNQYVLSKGTERLVVLYWYQAHGRVVASEYWAKFYLVADAIRMNRTDGALVRIITPITGGESAEAATQRAAAFANAAFPNLNRYIPE